MRIVVFGANGLTGRLLTEQATDVRFVCKAVAVTTSEGAPTLFQMMRREAFKRD